MSTSRTGPVCPCRSTSLELFQSEVMGSTSMYQGIVATVIFYVVFAHFLQMNLVVPNSMQPYIKT